MKPAEESVPRHRVEEITWDSEPEARRRLLKSEYCGPCGKLSLRSKVDARSYIGLLISKPGRRMRPNECVMRPYECEYGNGWHVGRDYKTAELLKKGKA